MKMPQKITWGGLIGAGAACIFSAPIVAVVCLSVATGSILWEAIQEINAECDCFPSKVYD